MRKMYLTVVILFLAIVTAGPLNAQPNNQQGPGHARQRNFVEKLHLTAEQKKELDDLRTSMQKNAIPLQSSIQLARIDLRDLLKAESPDKEAIEKKLNEIAKIQTEQKMLRINHWFDVKKILTPEQLKVWRHELQGMWLDHGKMKEPRGGRMGKFR